MKKTFFAFFMLAAVSAHAKGTLINNPMKYAEDQSKAYAEGDANDSSGWQGCWEEDYMDTSIRISCSGTQSILVHGGHMASVPFSCEFTFQPGPSVGFKSAFSVVGEECN